MNDDHVVEIKKLLLHGASLGSGVSVFLRETLDAARRIHQLLLSGEERVAAGADFHADIALMRGPCLERVTACADHIDFFVSGVDSCFHVAGNFLSGEI